MFLFSFISILLAGEYQEGIIINKKYYVRDSIWESPPDILICNDSDIHLSTIKKAVDIWKSENEKIGKIILEKDGKIKCNNDHQIGYIKFTNFKNNFNEDYYDAMSIVYWEKNKQQKIRISKSAIIETTKYAKDSLHTTVHELGHSFGFDHIEIINDIMSY